MICYSYETIKKFLNVFYPSQNLSSLSDETWFNFFHILDIKYTDVFSEFNGYILLCEWELFFDSYAGQFVYKNELDCLR